MPQLGKSGLSLLPKHIIFSKRKTTGLQRLKNNKPLQLQTIFRGHIYFIYRYSNFSSITDLLGCLTNNI